MTSATIHERPLVVRPRTTVVQAPSVVPGPFRRVARVIGDLLGATAIVLCIPFVIIAVAMPLVLCIRLLMWLAALR